MAPIRGHIRYMFFINGHWTYMECPIREIHGIFDRCLPDRGVHRFLVEFIDDIDQPRLIRIGGENTWLEYRGIYYSEPADFDRLHIVLEKERVEQMLEKLLP